MKTDTLTENNRMGLENFFKNELEETYKILKNDVGQLDMKKDPVQGMSFTRGKQAAFCMSQDRIKPFLKNYDALLSALKNLIADIEYLPKEIPIGCIGEKQLRNAKEAIKKAEQ